MGRGGKADLEVRLRDAVVRFHKEYRGRGPATTRVHLLEDKVLVCCRGLPTPAEAELAESARAAELLRQLGALTIEQGRRHLEEAVAGILGVRVRSVLTDSEPRTGESFLLFLLESPIDVD